MAANGETILIVMPTSVLGGAERLALNLAENLLQQGYTVTTLTMMKGRSPGWDRLDEYDGFRWLALPASKARWSFVPGAWAVIRFTSRYRPNLVFTTHTHMTALVSLLRRLRLCSIPVHIARESTNIFQRMTGFKRLVFRALYACYCGIDLIICQTTEMKDQLISGLPYIATRAKSIKVIPNPVNVSAIDKMILSGEAVEFADFVFCGRLIPLKRVDLIVRALAKLPEKAWSLAYIVGDGPEGRNLASLAADLGIRDKIRFTGNVNNPFVYYRAARVGVLASSVEGFPNVLLEMMAAGVDRIVSSLCTLAVNRLPGVDVVDPIDDAKLASALIAALVGEARSRSYRKYVVENRSVTSFWNEIGSQIS